MRNYERSTARGAASSTSIKTNADCNSTRKRAAINRKYIVPSTCPSTTTRLQYYAHMQVTPRVPRVLIRLCALLKQSYMRRDKLFTLRLHVEMVLSAIFQESNILKYINNKYVSPREKERMQIFTSSTHSIVIINAINPYVIIK